MERNLLMTNSLKEENSILKSNQVILDSLKEEIPKLKSELEEKIKERETIVE
jgi:hypothetical protein